MLPNPKYLTYQEIEDIVYVLSSRLHLLNASERKRAEEYLDDLLIEIERRQNK